MGDERLGKRTNTTCEVYMCRMQSEGPGGNSWPAQSLTSWAKSTNP